jgi:hypothetical protein
MFFLHTAISLMLTPSRYYNPSLIWYIASFVALIAVIIGLGVPALVSADEAEAYAKQKAIQDGEEAASLALAAQEKLRYNVNDALDTSVVVHNPTGLSSGPRYRVENIAPLADREYGNSAMDEQLLNKSEDRAW